MKINLWNISIGFWQLLIYLIPINCAIASNSLLDLEYEVKLIEQNLIHIVTVNPTKHKIINISAKAINKNVAYVSQIARKYHALAAINGGFFREIAKNLYVPAGALKINNYWQGIAYHPRGAIGWKSNTDLVLIDQLKTKTTIKTDAMQLPVSHFNPKYQFNNNYKTIVYSNIYPYFEDLYNLESNNFITITTSDRSYIFNVIPELMVNDLNIKELATAKIIVDIFPQIEPNTKQLWENVDFITSGAPILIKNNQAISNYAQENLTQHFIHTKHPRTAICITNNSFWKFVKTPDITIPMLANIMQTLNCKDAINLDGGSSSDLYLCKQLSHQKEFTNMILPITDAIMVLSN